ncbi:MAG TPA: adenylate/guanylate cyclase domain-containing protein, partial [Geminicoccaceae bacterium]|nr:adenylate/guanylate cyclase domain-containing protein [Geminicoccaceae bacterium]
MTITDGDERELVAWLVRHGIEDDREDALLDGFCARLVEAGLPVVRAVLGADLLHPLFDARSYTWRRGGGIQSATFPRGTLYEESEDWRVSPFGWLLSGGHRELRRRLDGSYRRGEFPLLDRFQDEGMTDYLALAVPFPEAATLGKVDGILSSFQTDREGGFTDRQVALIRRLIPPLALAFKAINAVQTGRTLMATYLGQDAGRRVLSGSIDRGRAETLDCVLWYSDLESFTRIADTVPEDELLALLNDYAECVVDVVHAHEGQVLKFMGDGILAIFPLASDGAACARALDAAARLRRELAALNERRAAAGRPATGFYLALHVGAVLYGNIGSRERLDFTVVGPAVNEAARIEAMCRSLDQWLIVSAAFAAAAGATRGRLVSLGRYAL